MEGADCPEAAFKKAALRQQCNELLVRDVVRRVIQRVAADVRTIAQSPETKRSWFRRSASWVLIDMRPKPILVAFRSSRMSRS